MNNRENPRLCFISLFSCHEWCHGCREVFRQYKYRTSFTFYNDFIIKSKKYKNVKCLCFHTHAFICTCHSFICIRTKCANHCKWSNSHCILCHVYMYILTLNAFSFFVLNVKYFIKYKEIVP